MFKQLLIVGLALLAAACVPIPPLPPEAATGPETSGVMTDQLESCDPTFSILKVGHGADDLPSNEVPEYVDVLRVESSLEGETLTVVFYLKDLPQELTVKREGLPDSDVDAGAGKIHYEYYWNVNIDVEGVAQSPSNNSLFDYMFSAVIDPGTLDSESPPTDVDFLTALELNFFRFEQPADRRQLSHLHHARNAHLQVAYEDSSLTFSSRVPGISENSTLFFYTGDVLLGHDGISCES